MAYRVGVQYRERYELQLRLDEDEMYQLPPLPPEFVTAAGSVAVGIISNIGWDAIKTGYNKLRENSAENMYPDINATKTYQVIDFMSIMRSEKMTVKLIKFILIRIYSSKLAAEDGFTLEDYKRELEQKFDLSELESAPTPEDVPITTHDQYIKKAVEHIQSDTSDFTDAESPPTDNEFEWYTRYFELDEEMKDESRKKIVHDLVSTLLESVEHATQLYKESKAFDVDEIDDSDMPQGNR
jgi:hypothetical protein